jgi:hypothetical protein
VDGHTKYQHRSSPQSALRGFPRGFAVGRDRQVFLRPAQGPVGHAPFEPFLHGFERDVRGVDPFTTLLGAVFRQEGDGLLPLPLLIPGCACPVADQLICAPRNRGGFPHGEPGRHRVGEGRGFGTDVGSTRGRIVSAASSSALRTITAAISGAVPVPAGQGHPRVMRAPISSAI